MRSLTMSVEGSKKINYSIQQWPKGTIAQTFWLRERGYSNQLLNRYKKSGWIESFGTGAYQRSGETVGFEGAVYALQKQLNYTIHPGGPTALSLQGKAHYLELSQVKALLFGISTEKLPLWFTRHDWNVKVEYFSSSFLPGTLGLVPYNFSNFDILISGSARAMMECLYLAPKQMNLLTCYELMEGLSNLRPNVVQELLEQCASVKVKRLFLYMAEKAGHTWFNFLKLDEIDLGKGKRSIVPDGVYNEVYQITVPKELKNYGRL